MTLLAALPPLPYYTFEEAAVLLDCELEDLEHVVFVERHVRPAIVLGQVSEFYYHPKGWNAGVVIDAEDNYSEDLYEMGLPTCLHIRFDQIENHVLVNERPIPTVSARVSRSSRLKVCNFEDDYQNNVWLSCAGRSQFIEIEADSLVLTHVELRRHFDQIEAEQSPAAVKGKRLGNLQRIAGSLVVALRGADNIFNSGDPQADIEEIANAVSNQLADRKDLDPRFIINELRTTTMMIDERRKGDLLDD